MILLPTFDHNPPSSSVFGLNPITLVSFRLIPVGLNLCSRLVPFNFSALFRPTHNSLPTALSIRWAYATIIQLDYTLTWPEPEPEHSDSKNKKWLDSNSYLAHHNACDQHTRIRSNLSAGKLEYFSLAALIEHPIYQDLRSHAWFICNHLLTYHFFFLTFTWAYHHVIDTTNLSGLSNNHLPSSFFPTDGQISYKFFKNAPPLCDLM